MFQKFFIAAISVIAITAGQFNICGATMPRSQMYLGWIGVGSSYSEMVKIYGEPIQIADHAEDNYSCRYGNSVAIGCNKFSNKIQSVTVSANNGWKNPDGLEVGMNISRATDLYGKPDYQTSGSTKTAYCYFHKTGDEIDSGFIILFYQESGRILELRLQGGNSMASFEESYQNIMERMVE